MAQENVETLQVVYEAVSRGDWDATLREMPANFELKPAEDNPIAGTYRGPAEVRRFFDEFWAAFAEVGVQPERFVDLDDRILVFLLMHLRPTDSAAMLETRVAHLWTVQDGDLIRCEVFREPEDALEAAGLTDEAVSLENVETVRRVIGALRAGDYVRAASEFEPNAKWHNTDAFPGPKVCSGIEEIRVFWEEIFEAFDREGMEVDDFAQSGNTVVVRLHSWGTGKASGAPIDVRWASVYEFRDGKVVSVIVHGDYDKALEAAGLSDY